MILAGASADNPSGLWALVQQRGVHANREIVDAEDPRCPAFEVRERVERARDRARHVAQQRVCELVSPARPHGGLGLALAGRARRRGAGAPSVPAGCGPGCGGRSCATGMGGARQGDAAQGRHPGALVGGVSRRSSGRVRLQLVLRAIRRLQEPAAPVDAAKPCRRREGVRRLRRRHDRRHRPFDRRGAADEAVRRRHGRVELHLRAGAAERADRRLDRRARGPARFPGRRAEVRGLRQSQGRGHQPGPLRAGPEPQLSGVRRPLRRGDPAGAALQTARQGQGRAVGPDRRALDSRPGCAIGGSSAPPISTSRSPNTSATSTSAS